MQTYLLLIALIITVFLPISGISDNSHILSYPAFHANTEERIESIVIKYKAQTNRRLKSLHQSAMAYQLTIKISQYSNNLGVAMSYKRPMSGDAHVIRLEKPLTTSQAKSLSAELAQNDEIAFAQPDYLNSADFTPNDAYYLTQQDVYLGNSGIRLRLPHAWDKSRGKNINVAVIDTGYLAHHDLDSKILPGYDFISGYATCVIEGIKVLRSNDGDKRDPDASDPGTATSSPNYSCASGSSWHGTKVAGIIAAETNNNSGIAGVAPDANILPVRVLGLKGLGSTSDIVDGMRWAAGLPVPGVPQNPNPAQVLNLSLSGARDAPCGDFLYRSAVNDVLNAGVVIVSTAGNINSNSPAINPADYRVPGSCNGVISTASINTKGHKAAHSMFGSVVDIAAPGEKVFSLSNNGQYTPKTDSYTYNTGTSFAAPHVSGIVALMLQVNPSLSPKQIEDIIENTATPFPADCTNCFAIGAGIINAKSAVNKAITMIPTISPAVILLLLDDDKQ